MRHNKTYRISAFFLALSLFFAACGSESSASSIRLRKAEGTVRVSDDRNKKVEARENLKLYDGYGVRTKSESYAWVTLDSVKLTKLDQLSDAEIRQKGKKLQINVTSGSLFFHITEPLEEDESMEIHTSTLAIGIRGTCGWVEVSEDGKTGRVYILEGRVECSAIENGAATGNGATDRSRSVFVTAGETASLTEGGEITVEKFDPAAIPSFIREETEEDEALDQIIREVAGQGGSDASGGQDGSEASAGTSASDEGGTPAPAPVFIPWAEAGLEDHVMDWQDDALKQAMQDATGIKDRDIMLSDVWERQYFGSGPRNITNINALGELTNLTDLQLTHNQIRDVTALGNLTNLTELDLIDNQIGDVTALGSLTSLTKLYLDDNQINDVTALGSLASLTELSLSGNQISDVTALGSLTSLTYLSLNYNQISDVTALGNLTSLANLGLADNPISDFSALDGLTGCSIYR